MKTLGYFKNVSRIYPWISGPTMNSVVQSMVQTFPVSEKKKIGGPGSMIHKRWISGLGHEFSGTVHGLSHFVPGLLKLVKTSQEKNIWNISFLVNLNDDVLFLYIIN